MRRLRIFLAVLALSLPLALPASAQTPSTAPPPCECFCKSDNGAADKGQLTPAACNSTCAASPYKGTAVCAADATFYPQSNPFCYASADECVKQDAQGRDTATWDTNFQPPECMSGAHYCYPKRYADISLGFALGNVTKVSDLGNYIQVAYNVLLGIGTTIAIVMLMIGGFQYVIGAGAPEQLAKGKARMKNAVIGLVLLMSAYVILFTVNPQLVRLEVPALRLSKGIEFIRPETSCEFLISKGYALDDSKVVANKDGRTDRCGAVAPVIRDNNGVASQAGATCQYSACGPLVNGLPNPDDGFCAGAGKAASCLQCQDLVPSNEDAPPASTALCSFLEKPDVPGTDADPNQNQVFNECFFSSDIFVVTGAIPTPAEAVSSVIGGACAELSVSCGEIDGCEAYMSQKAENRESISGTDMGFVDGAGDLNGQKLCEQDPCHAANKGGRTGKRCVYEEGTFKDSCVTR